MRTLVIWLLFVAMLLAFLFSVTVLTGWWQLIGALCFVGMPVLWLHASRHDRVSDSPPPS